ncbi:MAG: GNAT family N-acetyltransferase, partial [candidate division Zixibacteria bacterium]|nr:GNAT family N-acetyltransferase [candidate division Zixibacteria bacterium]
RRISKWDYDLFGVKMASLAVLSCGDSDRTEKVLSEMIDGCLAVLRDNSIAFVSCRISGDNIAALHAFESRGFRYYENIIWPVASGEDISADRSPDVRLMTASDFDQVVDIASTSTFQRSHYHCDEGFNKRQADQVLAKYIKSAWAKDEPIAIIESEGRVAGFFAFKIDEQLSSALGYRYGRMKNLALDSRNQSKGLGTALFSGAMSLMKEMGAEYIDSGYSSKNHVSARLHARHAMYSVYEEATFHLWL